MLYTAAELAGAGITAGATINKLAFNKIGAGATVSGGLFSILMRNSATLPPLSTATTWASILTTHTEVYSNTNQSIPATTGWIEFTLATPFVYNGGNVEIAFNWNIGAVSGDPTTEKFDWQYSSGTSDYIIGQVATTTPPATLTSPGAIYKHRPNIQITYIPGPDCTAPPTPGTALATPSTIVCQLTPVFLSLSGNSSGNGQTYRWQSAPALAGPFTDITTDSPAPSTTVNPTTTTYYRAVVTCSGQSDNSTPVEVLVNPGLPSGTYTINSAVVTGGTNYQTFAAAIAAMNCGIQGPVVFNVDAASGPYNEQLVIPQIINTSSTNTVTFNGNGRTVQATPVSATRALLKLDGADYITVNNLRLVSQDATYGWGVHITNIAENNTINNCTIDLSATTSATQTNSGGIVASGSATSVTSTGNTGHNNNITGNTIIGAYQGIIMNGNSANPSTNNVVSNNIIRDFYANGIELTYHNGTTVSGNDISRATRAAVTTFAGMEIGIGCNSLNINANRIHDTHNAATLQSGTAYGIYFNGSDAQGGTENIVSNNLIYNFNSLTGTQYGLYNSSSNNVWYYYNTVILDNAASTAGLTRAFYQTTLADGIELKNNLLYVTRGGTGAKHLMYYGTATTTFVSDNNLLYINSPAGTNSTAYLNPDTYATLGDWQNLNAYDLSSTDVAPSFVSPATGDFTPVTASIDNLGVPVSVNTDILNNTRDASTPDIGAYEFAVSGCLAPPTAGTASVTPSGTLCAGTLVDFILTGNSIGTGQTYQWESSATSGTGFTSISAALADPAFSYNVSSSQYYRVAVTCSGNTQYSNELYIAVPSLFPAGTYTINSAVVTGGSNFQTIGEAVSAIQCGVTGAVTFNVDAASGPYNEQVIIPQILGTDAANRIVFNGNGRTISFLSTNTNERAGIKLNGADFVTINNFIITATGTATTEYGFGIQVLGDADNNIISNNVVNINTSSASTNYSGIAIGGSATSATATGSNTDDNVISGNTVTGGNYGISLYGVSTVLIQNNQIINNIIRDQDEEGIYVTYTNNTLVENNDISRPTRLAPDDFTGIYFSSLSTNARVSKNRIHDPFGGDPADASIANGIYFTGCDATAGNENIVTNNAIYNFIGGGTQYGIYSASSDSVWFHHNTINLDDAAYSGTSATRGLNQLTTSRGVEFRNNIVRISRGGTGIKYLLYHGATTTASTILSDNNDLYMASPAGTNYVGYLAVPTPATSFASLAEWRTGSGQDIASDSLEPFFVDAAAGNLAPREILLDNKGFALGITTDILNTARSATTPDVGAWEFTGSVTLPVKLLNIFASKIKNDVLVNWATASEINSSRFEVERSVNGTDFYFAGSLPSANNVNGASYSFKDNGAISLATGPVMYYRIKMIDIDGSYEYSFIATVKVDKELKFTAEAFPNPFRETATIKFTAITSQTVTIQVTDIRGKVLIKEKRTIPAGVSLVALAQSHQLAGGMYLAVIEFNGEKQTLQLIRQ
jgi:parallel beta-helix repeat protein